MCRQAAAVYVLADATKLGRELFHARAPLPAGWVLETDATAGDALVAEFTGVGVDVRVVGADGTLVTR